MQEDKLLTLAQARLIIDRAIKKASELSQLGVFVVVDGAGNPVSISRMDGAGSTAVAVSLAKAYLSSVNREPSARFVTRISRGNPNLFSAYRAALRRDIFPGPGAMPITIDGAVVGAISTGAGIGPTIKVHGVDARRFLVGGHPANAEDLIISYALETPYEGQHGDDRQRWFDAYGSEPPDAADAPLPPIDRPAFPRLDTSRQICESVISAAQARRVRVAVAVTDRHGELIQLDRMEEASPMTADAALAKAVTALNFEKSTSEVAVLLAAEPTLALVPAAGRFSFLPVAGGVPLFADGRLIGAIGVCGTDHHLDGELALLAVAQ